MREVIRFGGLQSERSGVPLVAFDTFDVVAGARVVVFGPNGAGKTSLLRAMARTPTNRQRADVAYLPQRPYAFRGTGKHNLGLGLAGAERRRSLEIARELGITDALERPAHRLSGGERQRLALARTLASDAQIVLLDEPLAPLDLRDRERVAAVIVHAIGSRSAVIVSHDQPSAAILGEEVAVMIDGEIRQRGPVAEVFSLPVDDRVAEVVGLRNVLTGRVEEADPPLVRVVCDGIAVWALGEQVAGAHVRVMFGAEAVTVYGSDPITGSARNVWKGTVIDQRQVGRLVEVVVDAGPNIAALLTPGSLEALDITAGATVTLAVKATAVRSVELGS